MTDMDVIAIANDVYGKNTPWHGVQRQRLVMLAERLVAAEREACAKVAEVAEPYQAADLIRARGKHD